MPLLPEAKNVDISVKKNFRKISKELGYTGSPTFVSISLTGLTASRLIWTDSSKVLASKDLIGLVAGTANEINIANDGSGGITIGIVNPLIVSKGGTGAATLTDGGILLGSGTGAITALGVASNGQIPIGNNSTDPVLATITGTSNRVTVTNGAGTITLTGPQDIHTGASPTFAGLTLTGNLTMPDGGTIGQSAGPLLTFNNTDNILKLSGGYLDVVSPVDLVAKFFGANDDGYRASIYVLDDGHVSFYAWDENDGGTAVQAEVWIGNASVAGTSLIVKANGNIGVGILPVSKLTIEGTLTLKERATAIGDTANYGQIWVKNTTPNELWFTRDDGTNVQIA